MKLNIPAFVTAVALGACTAEAPDPASVPQVDEPAPSVAGPAPSPEDRIPQDASKGPSGVDTAMWFTDTLPQNGVRRLMYSARHSDEMAINMQCRSPGKVTALIVRNTGDAQAAPAAWPFTLMSGNETMDLEGKVVRADSDVLIVEAELALTALVLAAMARSGEASLRDQEGTVEMNAVSDGEREAIADFIKECTG